MEEKVILLLTCILVTIMVLLIETQCKSVVPDKQRNVDHKNFDRFKMISSPKVLGSNRENRASHLFKNPTSKKIKRQVMIDQYTGETVATVVDPMTGLPYATPIAPGPVGMAPGPLGMAGSGPVMDPLGMLDPLTGLPLSPSTYYGSFNNANVGPMIYLDYYDFMDPNYIVPNLTTDLVLPPNLRPYAVTPEFLANYPPTFIDFQLLCDPMYLRCFYYYYNV